MNHTNGYNIFFFLFYCTERCIRQNFEAFPTCSQIVTSGVLGEEKSRAKLLITNRIYENLNSIDHIFSLTWPPGQIFCSTDKIGHQFWPPITSVDSNTPNFSFLQMGSVWYPRIYSFLRISPNKFCILAGMPCLELCATDGNAICILWH